MSLVRTVQTDTSLRRRVMPGWVAVGTLLFVLILATNIVEAQEGDRASVPVDVYWQQVDEALGIIHELDGTDAGAVKIALISLASEFEAISGVELVDGRRIPLDNSYLIARLKETDPDLERLAAYLKAVQASRERWPEPSHDGQDLDPLVEILARPEFQVVEAQPGPIQRTWQRIVDFLEDFIFRLFPETAGGLGPLIRLILTAVGIISLVVASVFVLRGVMTDIVADEKASAADSGDLSMISADQALEQAHSFSRDGDYRSAVRYLYISSLLLLEERELLRYDRTQTNQEYLRSIAGKPELVSVLQDVISVFDRVWYGFQSLDQQSFARYASQVEQLRRQQ